MDGSIPVAEESTSSLLPPKGYTALCIANLILFSISTILCVILIISMTLPLLSPKRRKAYSTFNLYLAYLSVPDLIFNTFFLYLVLTQTPLNPNNKDDFPKMYLHDSDYQISIMCIAANMYLNAFLACEVYGLLKNSNARKRYVPPSIARVTKQAIISFGFGVFVFFFNYLKSLSPKWMQAGTYVLVIYALEVVLVLVIPLSILIGVCRKLYRQGLYFSTQSMHEGRLRVLTLFFGRIVAVYVLVWIPAFILNCIYTAVESPTGRVMAYGIGHLFAGSQVILSFALSLTKPDTRKLITDVVTFIYCRKCTVGRQDGDDMEEDELQSGFQDPRLRTTLSVSLPYGRRLSFKILVDDEASLRNLASVLDEDTVLDGRSPVDSTNGVVSNEYINGKRLSITIPIDDESSLGNLSSVIHENTVLDGRSHDDGASGVVAYEEPSEEEIIFFEESMGTLVIGAEADQPLSTAEESLSTLVIGEDDRSSESP